MSHPLRWILAGLALLVALVAVGMAVLYGQVVVTDTDGCPRQVAADTSVVIAEWVPLVVVDDTRYLEVLTGPGPATVPDELVGERLATTRCRIDEAVPGGNWQPRDGDATYLPVGTPVHEVVGVDPAFEVAVLGEDGPRLYRRDLGPVPDASGEDVVPLTADEVTGIALLSEEDGSTELGRIDTADVADVVDALRAASVEPPTSRTVGEVFVGPRVFVSLERRSGLPPVTLVVFTEPGLTTEGLVVPDPLLAAVRAAV